MRRLRTVTPVLPSEIARHDGIAYSLWLPPGDKPRGGVLILHGADSCKESHHDFARLVLAAGLAALAFDQRGHGASPGPMDGRVLGDISAMAALLRTRIGDPAAPIVLRGSSMGGALAIIAAEPVRAAGVVAICPASVDGLRTGLEEGRFDFAADPDALDAVLGEHDLAMTLDALTVPVLLLHAEGDEVVPVEHSRELARHLHAPTSRLIAVPGGHHRSIQHDGELQAVSLRFIERAVAG